MRWPVSLSAILALGLAIWGCQTQSSDKHLSGGQVMKAEHGGKDQGIQTLEEDFAVDQLFDLEHFAEPPLVPIEQPWMILVYFDQLTCTTCLNQNTGLLAQMKREMGDQVAFVAVVRGDNFNFLRDLKRMGKFDYPLLIEPLAGQIGLEAQFQINLIRMSDQKLVLRYLPVSSQPHLMPIFETKVRSLLKSS